MYEMKKYIIEIDESNRATVSILSDFLHIFSSRAAGDRPGGMD